MFCANFGRKTMNAAYAMVCFSLMLITNATAHPHANASAWSYPAEQAARAAYAKEDWGSAAEAFGQFADANPFHAAFRQNQAYALHRLGRHAEAADAWMKALELGYQPPMTMFNIACANASLGKSEEALRWLERALREGYDRDESLWKDSDLDSLRSLPRFRDLTGIAPSETLSREEGWRYDLDHMVRRMEWMHYDLYRVLPREKLREAIDSLKTRVGALDDEQMILGVQRIVAAVGDGHTSVMLLETFLHGLEGLHPSPGSPPPTPPRMYPIDLYLFGDGLFVRDAASEHSDLIGRRVTKIGDLDPHEAMMAVAPYVARDNDMGIISSGPLLLTFPAVARAVGVATEDGRLRLETQVSAEKTETSNIAPADRAADRSPLARLAGRGDPKQRSPLPLYLQNPDKKFWFEYEKESRIVYGQINAIQDDADRTLADFSTELMRSVNENDTRALVLDLRHNGGGNGMLNKPLIQALIRCEKLNQPGRLFVIIGRRTFSAAMNLATEIENWTQPIFVGEPTGSRPNAIGECSVLTLPVSKLRLSVSSLYHQNGQPRDERLWIAPRIPAELSSSDYFSNRDPALEAILKYLADSEGSSKKVSP